MILLAAVLTRLRGGAGGQRPPLLPWFAVGFAVLAAVNSTGSVPPSAREAGVVLSQWCLVTAMAAIGMKSRLKELLSVGMKPILLMIGETVFLAALVAGMLRA